MKLQISRFLRFADYLEQPKLGFEKFNFNEVGVRLNKGVAKGHCGSVGCGVGELPSFAPKLFRLFDTGINFRDNNYNPIGKFLNIQSKVNGAEGFSAAQEYFGIDEIDCSMLFVPNRARWWADTVLGGDATAADLAKSIREYVAASILKLNTAHAA